MAAYKSKTAVVNIPQTDLFARTTDLQGIWNSLPEDKKKDVVVEGDTVRTSYAGFTLAVRISERVPYSKVSYCDVEAPFHFTVTLHFDPASVLTQTTFWIEVDADLNFMMKTLLGGKIQEFLDNAVTMIASGGLIQ